MPDGAIILNADREILWFNRKAATMLGLSRKTDLGLRLDNLIRHPSFQRYFQQATWSGSVVVRPKATEDLWLAFQAMRIGEGQAMVLLRDVSREERTDAMRRDFVANASHELRSPLTVIAGYLETLATDEGVDPALRGPLQEMQRQAQRMTGIVTDLLELSRLEASDEEVEGEPIDVAALLGLLRKDLVARPTRPAEIRVQVESDQRLVGELGLIQSAFHNLADNAAKYTPAGGSVTLRWWTDEAGGYFAVTDTGVGIAAEHLPRLTERFYRVDEGRSRATGGSGLGLAIVKHALLRHGGDLEVRSVEGEGSTFTCHFPPARLVPPPAALKSA
jgi:two-component system phosphate regulon sensor histidine kinase PhoR